MASTLPSNQPVKLTKTVIDRTPLPSAGQIFLRDTELKGFGLRITAGGVRSFIVEKRIDGRVRRVTVGRFGELTCEQARKKATGFLGKLAMGENPIAERERARMAQTTLLQAFEDFMRFREHLSPKTVYDYRRTVTVALADWAHRPLIAIRRDMVLERHRELGEKSGEHYANGAMRTLRSLFNFAIAHYEDGFGRPLVTDNPVLKLTQMHAWYRSERRQTVIKVYQLGAWYRAVCRLRNDDAVFAGTVADYLLFLLLTGLRRSEGALLTWDRVDLKDGTLHIPNPKNREPFTLPLSYQLCELLARRKEEALSAHVFPGESRTGHLVEPRKQIAKVTGLSGVTFTLHDLRRTFITVAEGMDLSPYTIKRLVNHKMRNDVTAGYIITDVERMRGPMQKISDYFDRCFDVEPGGRVVPMRARAEG